MGQSQVALSRGSVLSQCLRALGVGGLLIITWGLGEPRTEVALGRPWVVSEHLPALQPACPPALGPGLQPRGPAPSLASRSVAAPPLPLSLTLTCKRVLDTLAHEKPT